MLLLSCAQPNSPGPGLDAASQEMLHERPLINHSQQGSLHPLPLPNAPPLASNSPHQYTQTRREAREPPHPQEQQGGAWSLQAWTEGMLVPPGPLCFEWLQWTSTRILAKCCWEKWSIPVCSSPQRAQTQSVLGDDALDFVLVQLWVFPSLLFLLLLKRLSNFPQTLILLILSPASPWYVFYLLF